MCNKQLLSRVFFSVFLFLVIFLVLSHKSPIQAQTNTCPAENSYSSPVESVSIPNYTVSYSLDFLEDYNQAQLSTCAQSNRLCANIKACRLTGVGTCFGEFNLSNQSINSSNQITGTMDLTLGQTFEFWLESFDANGVRSVACQHYYVKGASQVSAAYCDPGIFQNPVRQNEPSNSNITYLDPIRIIFDGNKAHNFSLGNYRIMIQKNSDSTTVAQLVVSSDSTGKLWLPGDQNNITNINLTPKPAGLYNISIVDVLNGSALRCGPYPFDVQDENNSIPNVDINDSTTDTGQTEQSFQVQTCNNGSGIQTSIGCVTTNPSELFASILRLAIGLAGGIAFLLIILGGVRILASAGNPEALNQGREIVTSAIAGLILIIFSVFILRFIGVDILAIPGFSTDRSSKVQQQFDQKNSNNNIPTVIDNVSNPDSGFQNTQSAADMPITSPARLPTSARTALDPSRSQQAIQCIYNAGCYCTTGRDTGKNINFGELCRWQ